MFRYNTRKSTETNRFDAMLNNINTRLTYQNLINGNNGNNKKVEINKQLLASKIGLGRGTFQNKLNPDHSTNFTEDELILLRCALIEMRHDLNTVNEIDFNTAMRLIAKKKV